MCPPPGGLLAGTHCPLGEPQGGSRELQGCKSGGRKVSPPHRHLCSLWDTSGKGGRWGGGALEQPRAPWGHQEQAKAALGTAESVAPRGEGS